MSHLQKKSIFFICIYLKQFWTAEKAAIFWENVTKNLLFSLWYLIFSVLTNCELDPDPHSDTYSTVFWKLLPPALRIHDILVWIRIRGWSMPLTNGFGSGFGSVSWYFRHWPLRSRQKLIYKKVFCLLLFEATFISFSKIKGPIEVKKTVGIMVFLTIFAWWWKDLDPYLWLVDPDPDPDPGGQNHTDPQHWLPRFHCMVPNNLFLFSENKTSTLPSSHLRPPQPCQRLPYHLCLLPILPHPLQPPLRHPPLPPPRFALRPLGPRHPQHTLASQYRLRPRLVRRPRASPLLPFRILPPPLWRLEKRRRERGRHVTDLRFRSWNPSKICPAG